MTQLEADGVTWIRRGKPRMLWKFAATIMGLGLLAGLVWDVASASGGPITSVYAVIWPSLLAVLVFGAVGVAFVSINFEPGFVGLSKSGVRFGRSAGTTWATWSEIDAPGAGLFGLVIRRRSTRGVLRLNYFLSPEQVRAILAYPGCPKWPISSEVRSQLELAEPRSIAFGSDRAH